MNGTPTRHPPLRLFTDALPSLVSSVAALPVVLFVPAFYSDDLGVPLAAVGLALAASRLLDVVTDPLIGIASDRLALGWGRRKPWIVLGTPLFAVALWPLFVPDGAASTGSLLGWSALLYLGFTMMRSGARSAGRPTRSRPRSPGRRERGCSGDSHPQLSCRNTRRRVAPPLAMG